MLAVEDVDREHLGTLRVADGDQVVAQRVHAEVEHWEQLARPAHLASGDLDVLVHLSAPYARTGTPGPGRATPLACPARRAAGSANRRSVSARRRQMSAGPSRASPTPSSSPAWLVASCRAASRTTRYRMPPRGGTPAGSQGPRRIARRRRGGRSSTLRRGRAVVAQALGQGQVPVERLQHVLPWPDGGGVPDDELLRAAVRIEMSGIKRSVAVSPPPMTLPARAVATPMHGAHGVRVKIGRSPRRRDQLRACLAAAVGSRPPS